MTRATQLYDLIRLVRPLYKQLEAAVLRGLDGTDLTVTERAVLEQIHDNGPLPVPRIAGALIAPRQFIQKTANRLIDAGLIERQRNAAHRRSVLLALTPAGTAQIAGILDREAAITAEVAAHLSTDDIAAARRVMQAMIDGYREKEINDD